MAISMLQIPSEGSFKISILLDSLFVTHSQLPATMGRKPRLTKVPCDACIWRATCNEKQTQQPSLCDRCRLILGSNAAAKQPLEAPVDQIVQRSLYLRPCHLTQELLGSSAGHTQNSVVERQQSESLSDTATLLSCCRTIVQAINDRDFTHPVWNLATSEFHADFLGFGAPTETFAECIAAFRQSVERTPSHHINVVDVTTDGGEVQSGAADVYMFLEITGRGPGLVIPCFGILKWRKDKDVWRWIAHTGMRSFGFLDG